MPPPRECPNPEDRRVLNYDNPDTFSITGVRYSRPMLDGSGRCKAVRKTVRTIAITPNFPPGIFTLVGLHFRISRARYVTIKYIQATNEGYVIVELIVSKIHIF